MQYCIRLNFRGAQFSRIAISKHFAETIFANQEFQKFRVYGILKFCELNFRELLGIHENCEKICTSKICMYTIYFYTRMTQQRWLLLLWRKNPYLFRNDSSLSSDLPLDFPLSMARSKQSCTK